MESADWQKNVLLYSDNKADSGSPPQNSDLFNNFKESKVIVYLSSLTLIILGGVFALIKAIYKTQQWGNADITRCIFK